MTDLDRRNVAPECAEPEPDAPATFGEGFRWGALLAALLCFGIGTGWIIAGAFLN